MVDLSKIESGEASVEEEAELLSQAVADFDAFLETQPLAEQHVQDILDRQLKAGITAETWRAVGNGISAYLGKDRSELVAWILTGDQIEGLQRLENYASPKVMTFLRSLVGIYGQDLDMAYIASDQLPHDWNYIYRNVYHDQVSDSYLLRLRVEKFNGEEVFVEGRPDSFLQMTELLMRSLISLGDPEVFTKQRISDFQDAASTLMNLLSLEEEKTPGTDSETQGTDGEPGG